MFNSRYAVVQPAPLLSVSPSQQGLLVLQTPQEVLVQDQEAGFQEEELESGSGEDEANEEEEEYHFKPEPVPEGIYGMAVCSLIIDYRSWIKSKGDLHQWKYLCRLFLALFLTLFTLALQAYLTLMTKFIVTPTAVRELRESYGEYEQIMYGKHTYLTTHGHHRGIKGNFVMENFKELPQDAMHAICSCTLAQPVFLGAILLVWTVTCLAYMRQSVTFTYRLLGLNVVPSMKGQDVLQPELDKRGRDTGRHVVIGITRLCKFVMIILVQMPVMGMNILLLWIGCRWLVATLEFGEVLLNAIALEFVLNLHEIFYRAIVPYTMQMSLGSVLVPTSHSHAAAKPSWVNMLSTFTLFFVAVGWVALYITEFQQVLPDYQWDIADVCHVYLAKAAFI